MGAFDLFDTEHSGAIDRKELKAAMQSHGYESKNDTIFAMLAELDQDGTAPLDFEELLDLMSGKEVEDEEDTTDNIFKLFDVENKGAVSVKDVMKVSRDLGERMTVKDVTEIVRRACQDEAAMEITPA